MYRLNQSPLKEINFKLLSCSEPDIEYGGHAVIILVVTLFVRMDFACMAKDDTELGQEEEHRPLLWNFVFFFFFKIHRSIYYWSHTKKINWTIWYLNSMYTFLMYVFSFVRDEKAILTRFDLRLTLKRNRRDVYFF